MRRQTGPAAWHNRHGRGRDVITISHSRVLVMGSLPTREKEARNEIDWEMVFSRFSCIIGSIWLARKKQSAAFFGAEAYGCPGAAFWGGFLKPQTQTIINYVSTGIPGFATGEHYCDSPRELSRIFDYVDPRPVPKTYCLVKPVTAFHGDERPELVVFFVRPESLCGLHQLATYVTNDPEVVSSPWSSACGSLFAWPLKYLVEGRNRAVVGGWDPSARKFFKTDELSFTVPSQMFQDMLSKFDNSFLTTDTWQTVRKKIDRSKRAWGEWSQIYALNDRTPVCALLAGNRSPCRTSNGSI